MSPAKPSQPARSLWAIGTKHVGYREHQLRGGSEVPVQALVKIVKDHIDLSFIPNFYIVAGLYDLEYVREKHPVCVC